MSSLCLHGDGRQAVIYTSVQGSCSSDLEMFRAAFRVDYAAAGKLNERESLSPLSRVVFAFVLEKCGFRATAQCNDNLHSTLRAVI